MKAYLFIILFGVIGLTSCLGNNNTPMELVAGEQASWPPKTIVIIYKSGRKGVFCDPDGDGTYTPCPTA